MEPRDEMPPETMMDLMTKIFRARGFTILNTSDENRYLLMEKGDEKRAVGYSAIGSPVTEGEAEMFISMALNDEASDKLFVAPCVLPKEVKRIFGAENVAIWERTNLSIAIGEAYLDDVSEGEKATEEDPGETSSIFDMFQTDDVNPIDELRSFRDEIETPGDGKFDFNVVKVAPDDTNSREENKQPKPKPTEKRVRKVDFEETPIKEKGKPDANRVPDEVLLDGHLPPSPAKSEVDQKERGDKKPSKTQRSSWSDYLVAPRRIPRDKAVSIAGSQSSEVKQSFRPALLCWVRYILKNEEGGEKTEEGAYIVDLLDGNITGITEAVATEMQRDSKVAASENQMENPKKPRIGISQARDLLTTEISKEVHKGEEMVHDGMMSKIYRESRSRPEKDSLEFKKNIKLLIPEWRGSGWSVDAYLGRLFEAVKPPTVQNSLKK